jgi:hypothetical protein
MTLRESLSRFSTFRLPGVAPGSSGLSGLLRVVTGLKNNLRLLGAVLCPTLLLTSRNVVSVQAIDLLEQSSQERLSFSTSISRRC